MSVNSFGIFQSLLTNAVTNDATLDDATRASMLTRINEMVRYDHVLLDHSKVGSVQGNVSVVAADNSIAVASGAVGNNRVEWDALQFTVPVDIDGGLGVRGFLSGHGGDGSDPLVDLADISLQYRTTASGSWRAFNRNSFLRSVTWVQFAADVADQGSDAILPQVNLLAFQL